MLSESAQTLLGRTPYELHFGQNPVNPLDRSGPRHGGACILRTADGGSSWSDVSPETGVDYRAVFLLDAQLAWVIRASRRADSRTAAHALTAWGRGSDAAWCRADP